VPGGRSRQQRLRASASWRLRLEGVPRREGAPPRSQREQPGAIRALRRSCWQATLAWAARMGPFHPAAAGITLGPIICTDTSLRTLSPAHQSPPTPGPWPPPPPPSPPAGQGEGRSMWLARDGRTGERVAVARLVSLPPQRGVIPTCPRPERGALPPLSGAEPDRQRTLSSAPPTRAVGHHRPPRAPPPRTPQARGCLCAAALEHEAIRHARLHHPHVSAARPRQQGSTRPLVA
jgi:hypothetical protein